MRKRERQVPDTSPISMQMTRHVNDFARTEAKPASRSFPSPLCQCPERDRHRPRVWCWQDARPPAAALPHITVLAKEDCLSGKWLLLQIKPKISLPLVALFPGMEVGAGGGGQLGSTFFCIKTQVEMQTAVWAPGVAGPLHNLSLTPARSRVSC